ncbi:MAG: Lon protease [candidate division WWE3 bacterium GW2011_GWD2_42_11]|uniref:AAA+ ATPase domain-containing protein n=3 Tax=Katanobacteria TaxID=422282 RepID=A0A1F4VZB7_UNCKA|nr:MAG: Lon protease [candidate division WWE3 bacterium GW2011_GWC2_41_23]KKS26941.1 MAG: ATP-dependent protease La, ATP-dependent Lon protease [candidate division WWE3 bacterium GW2011_GWC1_42_102]KKS29250.1 MAG: Lon protease [candidate division WWE3 bacterium GW2011_GWD2_42_11]KKS40975.1 MAG: Lon protease [candidate division WWE3 bacterium GW2011_GWE1_42_16]KKS51289.1 MAG: Lon protease [candidate division WWE3 bacterium GW2011_GWE2_42_25]KKS60631.1 MAG: Lon protease [candidate division WWE3 
MSEKEGKKDFLFEELKTLTAKVDETKGIPEDLADRLRQMIQRLDRMANLGHYATEYDTLARYIGIVTSIPWAAKTEDRLNLAVTKQVLDQHHYGLEYVKERILEYMSSLILLKQRQKDALGRAPILLMVGLQGVGKTTLAISIAEAMQRKFVRIAMGGIGSTLEIRGRSKAFPESEPGLVIKALISSGVKNPVILLDEIEKASGEKGLQSDIMAVLLEILDPAQNVAFRDHYIDFPVDLSDVMFICSANNLGPLSTALLDRMEIIKMPSYSDTEKMIIARDYVFPKVIENSGLKPEEIVIDPNLWPGIIRPFGYDSGIRSLTRTLESMCRKVAKEIVEGKAEKVFINADNLKYYLPK